MKHYLLHSWMLPVLLLGLTLWWWVWPLVGRGPLTRHPEPSPVLRSAQPCMMDNTAPTAHGWYVVTSTQVPGWCHVVTGEELPGKRPVLGLLKSWSSYEGQPAMVLLPEPAPSKGQP